MRQPKPVGLKWRLHTVRKQPAPKKGVYIRDRFSRVWVIEGIGPRRVIVRYLMTSRRYYHKRRLFDSHLKRGIYELFESIEDM